MHATPEHTFRDSLMILHLLRDDIILWSAEMLQEGACRRSLNPRKNCSQQMPM